MNKAKWSVLASAVMIALACAGGRSSMLAAAQAESPMATVMPSATGFGAGAVSTSDPLGALVLGYWNAALDGGKDTRRPALQQIEFLLRMPQAQSWQVAATLLEQGAIEMAESSARWPRALNTQAQSIASLARATLAEIESGPPIALVSAQSLNSASPQASDWRQGLRLQLNEPMELAVEGLSSCSTRVAYLTRAADGSMIGAGVLSAADVGKPDISAGSTVLRSFSAPCEQDLELSLSLNRPTQAAPDVDSSLALDTPYRFLLDSGEVRSYGVPNEVGVIYEALTDDLQDGADTRLKLYDADHHVVGENDDGAGSLASRLHWIGDGQPRTLEVAVLDGQGGRFHLQLTTEFSVALTADGEGLAQQSVPTGLWYQFQAPNSGRYRVDVDPGDSIDPVLMAFAQSSSGSFAANDDRGSGDLGAGLEFWMASGENISLLVGTRAEEGAYAIRVTPISAIAVAGDGQLAVSEINKPDDLLVLTPGERDSVSFDAHAGSTYIVAGRTDGLSLTTAGGMALTLLGEHAINAEAKDQSNRMRISMTCWQAQSDGRVQITLSPTARGVPIAVGRRAAKSGLCPQTGGRFSSAPTLAKAARAEANPVALNASTEVRLAAGATESWLVLPRAALAHGAEGIEFALRHPGSTAAPRGVKARLIDALTGTEVERTEGCGMQLFDVKSDRDYLIAIDSDQTGSQPTSVVLDLQAWRAHGGLKVGDRVVVHRHYVRQGQSNWARNMDAYLGKTAIVTERVDASPGEQLVRLDIDDGQHVWRAESLVPVGI